MATSGLLFNAITYLCGSIDYSPTLGTDFRLKIKEQCRAAGLQFKFLDPTAKLKGLTKDVGEEQALIQQFKAQEDWQGLKKLMKKIVRQDLRQVDLSDFLFMYINTEIFTCGSFHELWVALMESKPVLVVFKNGKKSAPSWLFGILDPETEMFDSIEEAVSYLGKLDSGEIPLPDKWVLFRKELELLNHES